MSKADFNIPFRLWVVPHHVLVNNKDRIVKAIAIKKAEVLCFRKSTHY
jgi:hypothetical protein